MILACGWCTLHAVCTLPLCSLSVPSELADGRGSSFPRSLPSGQSVSVQRSEQRGPGSYAYYESIQVRALGGIGV